MALLLVSILWQINSGTLSGSITDSPRDAFIFATHALSAMLAAFFLARSKGRGVLFSGFLSLGLHFGVFIAYGLEDKAAS